MMPPDSLTLTVKIDPLSIEPIMRIVTAAAEVVVEASQIYWPDLPSAVRALEQKLDALRTVLDEIAAAS